MKFFICTALLLSLSAISAKAGVRLGPNPVSKQDITHYPNLALNEEFGEAIWRIAQVAPQTNQPYTMVQGRIDGERFAENISTKGDFLEGILSLGIFSPHKYFLIGPAPLNVEALLATREKGEDYILGFKYGWEEKTRSKKRKAFLHGGGIGVIRVFALIIGINMAVGTI